MPAAVRALVIDFDGTICDHDVSEELLEAYAPPEWWDIDLRFQRGEIGSRECLIAQAQLLRASKGEMLRYALERYRVEPSFPGLVTWARERHVDVSVASDGLGFYIEPMLAAVGVTGVRVLTNEVEFGDGARFNLPNAHPVCVGCGTCKMLIVQGARGRLGPVAFVGEGHTDRYGALYADVVFAKKHLVDICRDDGVTFFPWETFDDVRETLEAMTRRQRPGAVAPEVCPGWQVVGGGTGI